jgi:hypothetical protein
MAKKKTYTLEATIKIRVKGATSAGAAREVATAAMLDVRAVIYDSLEGMATISGGSPRPVKTVS